LGLRVDEAVHACIADYDLDVFASFGERDGFDEFGNFVPSALGLPESDAIFASVISGCGVFGSAGGTS
jgi:hypothetical protein